jgi:hypothetical protein
LSDPDVQLFATPRASNWVNEANETLTLNISNFVRNFGVQVGVNANFYCGGSPCASDPPAEGLPAQAFGLLMSTGVVVSAQDSGDGGRYAALLFTTNKTPTFVFTNYPPGISTTGIHTAVTGFYPVLSNGVNFGIQASNSYPQDPSIHQSQPRTVFGVSQDNRYLFLMTIDGRQSSYSAGAYDYDMGLWMSTVGAWNAVNMDGGNSAAMYARDCSGTPKPVNRSSYIASGRGRERYIGAHLGVFAQPLSGFISSVSATASVTSATVTWTTPSEATSQVEYGLTTAYGTFSPFDATLVTNHSVTLNGLTPGRQYFYRVTSTNANNQATSACLTSFSTINPGAAVAFTLTNAWRYEVANLDGVNWTATNYTDSAWSQGVGCLWADRRAGTFPSPNAGAIPNYTTGTRMPLNGGTTYPYTTYYFRTAFVFSNSPVGATLTFSNFVDDGHIVYLNGTEVFRTNMPFGAVNNATLSGAAPCASGDATCPVIFTLSNSPALYSGTNVVAVEVHNFNATSPDVTFESALFYSVPISTFSITNVVIVPGETNATIAWQTTAAATTQVQYGTNVPLGSSTPNDAAAVTNHFVVLTNLLPQTQYYVRLVSSNGVTPAVYDATFSTVSFYQNFISLTQTWRFTTNNVSTTNWTATNYNDAAWPQGAGLLYIEDNSEVEPRTTLLPNNGSGQPMRTYYFRTHFTVTNPTAGFALLFSNYVDDGAVFYLNGQEIQRIRMAGGAPVNYNDSSTFCPASSCDAAFDVPDLFRLAGDALTNIVDGDNVLAAEVHQFQSPDTDVVFGSSVGLVRALASETKVSVERNGNVLKVSWTGSGLTLQAAGTLSSSNTFWVDLIGPVKTSPYYLTNFPGSRRFFRLRN